MFPRAAKLCSGTNRVCKWRELLNTNVESNQADTEWKIVGDGENKREFVGCVAVGNDADTCRGVGPGK